MDLACAQSSATRSFASLNSSGESWPVGCFGCAVMVCSAFAPFRLVISKRNVLDADANARPVALDAAASHCSTFRKDSKMASIRLSTFANCIVRFLALQTVA